MQTDPGKLATMRDVIEIGLAAAALLGTIYGYAKAIVKLNGLGGRLRKVEDKQQKQDESMQTMARDHERSIGDRQRLHEMVGEAKRAADEGVDTSITMRGDIVGAIHELQQKITTELGHLRERVRGLEVEVKHMNRKDP